MRYSKSILPSDRKITVLLLGSGSDFSMSVGRALGQVPGLELHEFSDENGVRGINRRSKHIKSYKSVNMPCRLIDPSLILQYAKQIAADVMIPVTEPAVFLAAQHRDRFTQYLKLPAIAGIELLLKVVNKHELNILLNEKGFAAPKNILIDHRSTEELVHEVRFPVLYKPVIGGGGWDIQRVDNAYSLRKLLKEQQPKPFTHILQEFIPGYNLGFSLLAENGEILASTIQKPLKDRGYTFATIIEFFKEPRLQQYIERVINAIGWTGIANLDLRYDERDDSYKIVDFNARYWSTLLGSLAAGINFPLLAVLQALELPPVRQEYIATSFMMNTPAVKALLRKRIGRKDNHFHLKNTELWYALRDWKPEIQRVWSHVTRELTHINDGMVHYTAPELQQMIENGELPVTLSGR